MPYRSDGLDEEGRRRALMLAEQELADAEARVMRAAEALRALELENRAIQHAALAEVLDAEERQRRALRLALGGERAPELREGLRKGSAMGALRKAMLHAEGKKRPSSRPGLPPPSPGPREEPSRGVTREGVEVQKARQRHSNRSSRHVPGLFAARGELERELAAYERIRARYELLAARE